MLYNGIHNESIGYFLTFTILDPEEANVTVLSAQYERHGVVVTLEWTQESSLYSYSVSVVPQLEPRFNGSTRVQLIVNYDILYNVSIVTSLCRRNGTFIKQLQYFRGQYTIS